MGKLPKLGESSIAHRPSEIHRNGGHLLFAHVSACGPGNRGRPQYSITNYHAVWLNVITFIRWPCRSGGERNSSRVRFPGQEERPFTTPLEFHSGMVPVACRKITWTYSLLNGPQLGKTLSSWKTRNF